MNHGDEIRVRIVGDGTWFRTQVLDAATGARIRGVSRIEIKADGADPFGDLRATLIVFPLALDLTLPGEIYVDGLELRGEGHRTALEEAVAFRLAAGGLPDPAREILELLLARLRRRA